MTFDARIDRIANGFIVKTSWYGEEKFFKTMQECLEYTRKAWENYRKEILKEEVERA